MKRLIAALGALILANCSGGTPAYAIFNCWTPADSAELALEKGYTLLNTVEIPGMYGEKWLVNDDTILVYYKHPAVGNKKLWCYAGEERMSEAQ